VKQTRRLPAQSGADQDERQYHDDDDKQHRGKRGKAVALSHRLAQTQIDRIEQDRGHQAPQDRAVKGLKHPGKRDRRQRNEQQEGAIFRLFHGVPESLTPAERAFCPAHGAASHGRWLNRYRDMHHCVRISARKAGPVSR